MLHDLVPGIQHPSKVLTIMKEVSICEVRYHYWTPFIEGIGLFLMTSLFPPWRSWLLRVFKGLWLLLMTSLFPPWWSCSMRGRFLVLIILFLYIVVTDTKYLTQCKITRYQLYHIIFKKIAPKLKDMMIIITNNKPTHNHISFSLTLCF